MGRQGKGDLWEPGLLASTRQRHHVGRDTQYMILHPGGQHPSKEGINRTTKHEDDRASINVTVASQQVGLPNLAIPTLGEPQGVLNPVKKVIHWITSISARRKP